MSNFILAVIVCATIGGYIANIVKLFHETAAGWIAGRIIGIIFPFLGAIAGYF